MYLGNDYTATAAGSVIKLVRCEQCSHEYGYKMSRKVSGRAFSALGLNNQNASDAATNLANRRLRRAIARSCDPVPCPSCGWYQEEMLARLRRTRFKWVDTLAILLFMFPIFATMIEGCYFVNNENALLCFGVTFAVGWSFIPLVLFGRRWLNGIIDPNARAAAARIDLGRQLALSPKRFARLIADRREDHQPE